MIAAQDVPYEVANMTPNKDVWFQICLSAAMTEATTWSISNPGCTVNQLESEA